MKIPPPLKLNILARDFYWQCILEGHPYRYRIPELVAYISQRGYCTSNTKEIRRAYDAGYLIVAAERKRAGM